MKYYVVEAKSSALPPSLIGRIVDARFELFEHIGSGELTHVFRAWDQRLHHVVAIKILVGHLTGDEGVVTAFEDAARRAANLPRHPNVVPVHQMGRDGDIHYLATEFVPGKNLQQVIADEAPLDVDRAFRIVRQVAQALEFAHQYGVIHQDIRPSNIMISARDDVKVTDFGLADAREPSDLARTRLLEATSPYISPAQALGGSSGVDSDIYSLGIVLWEMLTGAPPFRADNPVVLATAQTRQSLPDLRVLNPSVSPPATAIVMRALAWTPEQQFGSAASFNSAIQEYLDHEKGDTPRRFAAPSTLKGQNNTFQAPLPNESTPARQASAHAVVEPKTPARPSFIEQPPTRSRWHPSWASLVFLVTIGIAAGGGWIAYNAIWRALNGSGAQASSAHTTKHNRPGAARAGAHGGVGARRSSRHVATVNPNLVGSPGCANFAVGNVHLPAMWAEETHILPGRGIRFDYTISNDGTQCQNVRLGLAMYSSAHPSVALSDGAHDRVIVAVPGTHIYYRRFHFPATTAGQTLDALLTISNPSEQRVYAQIRVANLVTVAPR